MFVNVFNKVIFLFLFKKKMFSCLLIYYIDKKKQKTKARNRISL
jgi:hypothetical protein